MSTLLEDVKAARRAAVPLLAVETADPTNVIRQIKKGFKSNATPLICWDKVNGFTSKSVEGEQVLVEKLGPEKDEDDGEDTNNWAIKDLDLALVEATKFPQKTILFIMNGHRYIGTKDEDQLKATQAFWNLRDIYKTDKRMAIILCPSCSLPEELRQDVIVFEDPLPTTTELRGIVKEIFTSADQKPSVEVIDRTTESVRGLSSFQAEQVTAMSLTEQGMDFNRLWDQKRKSVEQVGMRIWQGTETFNDVRGVENLKNFLTLVMNGNDRPTVGVFWDEIEKAMAGSKSDTSGVSQEMHGQILSWMSDNEIPAMRFSGIQGCSKSYISKAFAGQYKMPLIIMNISEQKEGLVGASTSNLKNCLKTILAIGRPLVLATCNKEEALSPELKDRFSLGTYFFDLPSSEERKAVWDVWMKKYSIDSKLPVNEVDWTPRNIHDCCSLAWRLKCSLEEASKFIVPIIRSSPSTIKELRRQASGKYLSASKEGTYRYDEKEVKEVRNLSGMGEE